MIDPHSCNMLYFSSSRVVSAYLTQIQLWHFEMFSFKMCNWICVSYFFTEHKHWQTRKYTWGGPCNLYEQKYNWRINSVYSRVWGDWHGHHQDMISFPEEPPQAAVVSPNIQVPNMEALSSRRRTQIIILFIMERFSKSITHICLIYFLPVTKVRRQYQFTKQL